MEGTLQVPKKDKAADPAKGTAHSTAPDVVLPLNHPDSPHVTIHVQKGEGDDEKQGIYVGINGQDDFIVPRGVDVSVPVAVYEVLKNANRTQISEDGSETFEISRFAIMVKSRLPH